MITLSQNNNVVVCWLCARQQLEHAHNQPNWVTGISLLAWLAGVLWSGPRLLGAEAGSNLAEVYGIKVFELRVGLGGGRRRQCLAQFQWRQPGAASPAGFPELRTGRGVDPDCQSRISTSSPLATQPSSRANPASASLTVLVFMNKFCGSTQRVNAAALLSAGHFARFHGFNCCFQD